VLIFDHVGIACEDIESEFKIYEILGYTEVSRFEDSLQGVRGIFIRCPGSNVLELLEPLADESPLSSFIKSGIKMYHLAYRCERIDDAIDYLIKKGAILVSPAKPSVAFDERKVAFLLLRNRMLIEVIGR